jgi:hypothetical protein
MTDHPLPNTYALLARLRRQLPTHTDYALSKALGLSQTTLKHVLAGKHGLGPKPVIRLAEQLRMDRGDVLVLIEEDKAKTPEDKEFWGRRSPRISAAGAVAALALSSAWLTSSAKALDIYPVIDFTSYTLCEVRIVEAKFRIARRYAAAGPVGLISKRFSRPSNNRLHDAIADQVIKLLRSTYADFGPTLAAEKLRTKHGIDLAKETVRQLQIAVGLWIICANTPAAKGRVERAHLTMQDRLVKELRLEGISTIEAANAFMPTYVDHYNSLFGKVPRNAHDAHRPVRPDEDLDSIFAWREQRKVTSDLTLH